MSRYERPVYIIEKGVWGDLLSYGAYYSLVRYSLGGIEFTEYLENDEFNEREEGWGIAYEQE
jgi:hypothetical protein